LTGWMDLYVRRWV